ncbi:MAG TPA: hypothetical protein VN044_04325 [Verrucomicrobiae bacterium]|nr:hypothetical protein [Verrucomicrobiae bacterium]
MRPHSIRELSLRRRLLLLTMLARSIGVTVIALKSLYSTHSEFRTPRSETKPCRLKGK